MYNKYNKYLVDKYAVDWDEMSRTFGEIGNAPGVYPDVPYLFDKIVNNRVKGGKVRNVTEFGSGASTLYWAKICKKADVSFISYEEMKEYLELTSKLMVKYSADPNIVLYNNKLKLKKSDLVFLDSSVPLRKAMFKERESWILGTRWLLIDDAQNPDRKEYYLKELKRLNRANTVFYNPTGREDSVVLINYYKQNFDLKGFIKKL